MPLRLLGISGKRRAGKDTVAAQLIKHSKAIFPGYRVERMGLADPIKDMLILRFGCDRSKVYGTDEDKATKMPYNHALTYRDAMKKLGLVGREFDPLHWCRELLETAERYHRYHDNLMLIVPDVRFHNEVEFLQEHGGKVVRLTRNPIEDWHPSEVELDGFQGFDAIVDNTKQTEVETFATVYAHLIRWNWARGVV